MSDNNQNQKINNYPTLFERCLAVMIDGYTIQLIFLVLLLISIAGYQLLTLFSETLGSIFAVFAVIITFIAPYCYSAVVTYLYQRTIGKKVLGMKVQTTGSEKKVSLLVAIARELLFKTLFVGTFGMIAIIIILAVGKNDKGQLVHDRILNTTVVKLHDRNISRRGCVILLGLIITTILTITLVALLVIFGDPQDGKKESVNNHEGNHIGSIVICNTDSVVIYDDDGDLKSSYELDNYRIGNCKHSQDRKVLGLKLEESRGITHRGFQISPSLGKFAAYDSEEDTFTVYSRIGEIYSYDFLSDNEIVYLDKHRYLRKYSLIDGKIETITEETGADKRGNMNIVVLGNKIIVPTLAETEGQFTYNYSVFDQNGEKTDYGYGMTLKEYYGKERDGLMSFYSHDYIKHPQNPVALLSQYSTMGYDHPSNADGFSPMGSLNILGEDYGWYDFLYFDNEYWSSLDRILPSEISGSFYDIKDTNWYKEDSFCVVAEKEIDNFSSIACAEGIANTVNAGWYSINESETSYSYRFDILGNDMIAFSDGKLIYVDMEKQEIEKSVPIVSNVYSEIIDIFLLY
ncbi:hypothetical protein GF389_06225 [Candidatus Dojkabacteria bacterium]|nr:hypothetical protein [Candidatus Dojkabacteria bacterium]